MSVVLSNHLNQLATLPSSITIAIIKVSPVHQDKHLDSDEQYYLYMILELDHIVQNRITVAY